MTLEEKMFAEIAQWRASGLTKREFLVGKDYKEAKFDYWLLKARGVVKESKVKFQEIDFSQAPIATKEQTKVLEIETPTGLKITVFS